MRGTRIRGPGGACFSPPTRATPVVVSPDAPVHRPCLRFCDQYGVDALVRLGTEGRVTIGRDPDNAVRVDWDHEIAGVHTQLAGIAGTWFVLGDAVPDTRTFVNGVRVRGRRRLDDGDVLRIGRTRLHYRDPDADVTPKMSRARSRARSRCRPLLSIETLWQRISLRSRAAAQRDVEPPKAGLAPLARAA